MPAHSWTPTMPKMKKTKKQSNRTLPSIGSVSSNSITNILMPVSEEEERKNGVDVIRVPDTDRTREQKQNKNYYCYSLGIRLMALNGRNTRMVRMADRFMFSMSKQYSMALIID